MSYYVFDIIQTLKWQTETLCDCSPLLYEPIEPLADDDLQKIMGNRSTGLSGMKYEIRKQTRYLFVTLIFAEQV